jgi:hypothetical protein
MASSNTGSKVLLTSPQDWEDWDLAFKRQAVQLFLWEHVENPEKDFLAEPEAPDVTTYGKRMIATATRSQSQSSQSTIDADVLDPSGRPAHTGELTASELRRYNNDHTIYTHKLKKYNKQAQALVTLRNWVEEHVSTHLARTACDPTDTIRDWYNKLKEHTGLDEIQRTVEARDTYKAFYKDLRKVPKDKTAWIIAWKEIIARA